MIREVDMNDDFGTTLIAGVASAAPVPQAFYNNDGDCIEFLISNESYYAERVDDLLTVYHSQESGEIVGSLIKGVTSFVQKMLESYPGFAIEIKDGELCLTHLFSVRLWHETEGPKEGDTVRVQTYKRLRDSANEHHVSVRFPELV